jgi:hypothetical protein
VVSSPLNACQMVDGPPFPSPASLPPKKWILIATLDGLENDLCSLSQKARNAQKAGYSGIILRHVGSNDTHGVVPKFIGLDWIGVSIYACVVGDESGSFLMRSYTYPKRYEKWLEFRDLIRLILSKNMNLT